jgi:hypothetical protein
MIPILQQLVSRADSPPLSIPVITNSSSATPSGYLFAFLVGSRTLDDCRASARLILVAVSTVPRQVITHRDTETSLWHE